MPAQRLEPIRIGGVALRAPVAIAPMSGISDLPFRRAAWRAGAGLVVSEMVASAELVKSRPDVIRRAEGDPEIRPFIIQLAGREAKWLAEGARIAEASGADIVDINMGCPSRQVTGQLCGSALMREPVLARELIEATVKATRLPVTLKMRLGWDRSVMNAPDLARTAQDLGVQMIVVHGRTRNEFYRGKADWRAVAAVKAAIRIPLFVNGDIVDGETARQALALSGADGVMVGRATVGRPWLGGAIASALARGARNLIAPTLAEQVGLMVVLYREIIAFYGVAHGVRVARKHVAGFIDTAPIDASTDERRRIRAEICQFASPEAVEEALVNLAGASRQAAGLAA